jgi:type II secretory pathway component PulF
MGVAHFIAALIGIFAVTLIFVPVFPAFDLIQDTISSNMPNATTQEQQVIGTIEVIFYAVPIVLIIGLILYAIASIERREYDSTRDRPDF